MEIGKPVRVHEVEPEELDAPPRRSVDPPVHEPREAEEDGEPVPSSPDTD